MIDCFSIIIMSVSPFPDEGVMITVKLLLLGESSVGKTSLVNRYTNHNFEAANNLLTIGIEVRKIIKHLLGRKIRLERTLVCIKFGIHLGRKDFVLFQPITLEAYKESCYGESFFRVEDWLERIDQNTQREKLTLTLVGNKIDLEQQREVKENQALQFATSYSMNFSETSAKTGKGVDDMIEQMVLQIMEKGGFENKKDSIKLMIQPDKKQEEKEGCC